VNQEVRIKTIGKVGFVVLLIGLVLFSLGGIAFAGQNGPTPPSIGDPVGSDVDPHGGYGSTTDYCLQCHQVHGGGEYALLAQASVTATCKTCHSVFGTAAGTPANPGFPGIEGTASLRSAYDLTSPAATHGIGSSSIPDETGITITEGGWTYGWGSYGGPAPGAGTPNSTTPAGPGTASDTGGGLYCGSCHTPHGEFGQVINSKWAWTTDSTGAISTQAKVAWTNGTTIWYKDPTAGSWSQKVLHQNAGGYWEVCTDGTYTSCAPAQRKDSENQLVSLSGYKLLSAYPNHQYAEPRSWGVDKYDHDQPGWCGTCHPSKVDGTLGGVTGTMHNHPTGCTACHGNPATGVGTSADFPHTSDVSKFLINYPDALCIGCHTSGKLP
jgi:predicted CXXCH cytochrome family protein